MTTKKCQRCSRDAKPGYRFCYEHNAALLREMDESGYLTPRVIRTNSGPVNIQQRYDATFDEYVAGIEQ